MWQCKFHLLMLAGYALCMFILSLISYWLRDAPLTLDKWVLYSLMYIGNWVFHTMLLNVLGIFRRN